MEIDRINCNIYDQRGGFRKSIRTRILKNNKGARPPIDAVTFDSSLSINPGLQQKQEQQFLAAYVNSLSDEEVNRKMRDFKNSFDEIDDALIEKLIMEEL
jgi:hypothetical protein